MSLLQKFFLPFSSKSSYLSRLAIRDLYLFFVVVQEFSILNPYIWRQGIVGRLVFYASLFLNYRRSTVYFFFALLFFLSTKSLAGVCAGLDSILDGMGGLYITTTRVIVSIVFLFSSLLFVFSIVFSCACSRVGCFGAGINVELYCQKYRSQSDICVWG